MYDPFGLPTLFDGNYSSISNSAYAWNYLHQGLRWDGGIGKIWNRWRDYDPDQGRFLANDPKHFAAGDANLFRYVGNSPTYYLDPLGLQVESKEPPLAKLGIPLPTDPPVSVPVPVLPGWKFEVTRPGTILIPGVMAPPQPNLAPFPFPKPTIEWGDPNIKLIIEAPQTLLPKDAKSAKGFLECTGIDEKGKKVPKVGAGFEVTTLTNDTLTGKWIYDGNNNSWELELNFKAELQPGITISPKIRLDPITLKPRFTGIEFEIKR
jgi:RHS repeat-associated protein